MKHKEIRIHTVPDSEVKIKIMGVGGLGCNLVKYFMDNYSSWSGKLSNIIAVDSDLDALLKPRSPWNIQLGENIVNGLSTNGDIDLGKKSVIETNDRIVEELQDTDMLLIYTALGGGIGSGATPEIIKIAKELGVYCVTITSISFNLNDNQKEIVKKSLKTIKEYSDTYMVLDNSKISENPLLSAIFKDNVETINYLSEFIVKKIAYEIKFEKMDLTNDKSFYRRVCDTDFSHIINELKNDENFFISTVDGVEFHSK